MRFIPRYRFIPAAALALLCGPASARRPAEDLPELPAVPVRPGEVAGLDVAAREHGARVLYVSSEADRFGAENLIDGYDYEEGWLARPGDPSPTVVIVFARGLPVRLGSIVIDPNPGGDPGARAREVRLYSAKEVDAKTLSAEDPPGTKEGWTPLGRTSLPDAPGYYRIALPDVEAAVLRVEVKGGGGPVGLGSLRCHEAAPPGYVPLAARLGNVAAFAAGAHVVRHTPANGLLFRAFDGDPDRGWRGRKIRLPFDLVLGFRDERPVRIRAVEIRTGERADGADRVKQLRLAVSTGGPSDADFREIGTFPCPQDRESTRIEIPPAVARFLRVSIASNWGDPVTSVRELRVEEEPDAATPSIFTGPPASASANPAPEASAAADIGLPDPVEDEREPNDAPESANPAAPGRSVRGAMAGSGDRDWFAFTLADPEADLLRIRLRGLPYLKTELAVFGKDGAPIRTFAPKESAGSEANVSLPLGAGEYRLRVAQPPSYVAMVFDCSGSMKDSMNDLRAAAAAYLDRMTDAERIHLIRFGDAVEHLNEGFTSDRDVLKKAVAGKLEAAGGTALYDALSAALDAIDAEPAAAGANRALVLLSDGLDTTSRIGTGAFWDRLEKTQVRPYVIALGGDLRRVSPTSGARGISALRTYVNLRNGRLFDVLRSEELQGLYGAIASEMTRDVRYGFRLEHVRAPEGAGSLRVGIQSGDLAAAKIDKGIEIVLDCSGSMRESIGGDTKLEIAKRVIGGLVDKLPTGTRVGLRMFGQTDHAGKGLSFAEVRKLSCADSKLLIPVGPLDRGSFHRTLEWLRCGGSTPIAFALDQVPADFTGAKIEGDKLVILVSDGMETCFREPAESAARLIATGHRFHVNVVGFDIQEKEAVDQLESVARAGEGKYYPSANAEELGDALLEAVGLPYEVVGDEGRVVARGTIGRRHGYLPAGTYTVRLRFDPPVDVPDVRIEPHQRTHLLVRGAGGKMNVTQSGEHDPSFADDPAAKLADGVSRAARALRKGETDRAALELDAAAAIDAGHPAVLLLRGDLEAKKGNADAAKAAWGEVVTKHPDSVEAEEAKGRLGGAK